EGMGKIKEDFLGGTTILPLYFYVVPWVRWKEMESLMYASPALYFFLEGSLWSGEEFRDWFYKTGIGIYYTLRPGLSIGAEAGIMNYYEEEGKRSFNIPFISAKISLLSGWSD
ncbi:MAG: hypothetical protein N2323_05790, partial [candidate division WOR-3 bacterium]|nr:hypothetical protein [candidate division WOR-3 bacterium]